MKTPSWITTALATVVLAGCADTSGPSATGLPPEVRTLLQEMVIQAAFDGIWAADFSGLGDAPGIYNIGFAQSLPGIYGGMLQTTHLEGAGERAPICNVLDEEMFPFNVCWQVTLHEEGWATASVRFSQTADDPEGALTYAGQVLPGEVHFPTGPLAEWGIDYRDGASPAIVGTMDRTVTFTPEEGGAALDLSHTLRVEISSMDEETAVLTLDMELPALDACGVITVHLEDEHAGGVTGSITCGETALASIRADDQTFFGFDWND